MVSVVNDDGQVLDLASITKAIDHIVSQPANTADTPVGIFTTADRTEWAGIRQKIAASSPAALSTVDSALLMVALDDSDTPTLDDTAQVWQSPR